MYIVNIIWRGTLTTNGYAHARCSHYDRASY